MRANIIDSDFDQESKNAQKIISSIRESLDKSVEELENQKKERLKTIEENIRSSKQTEQQIIKSIATVMNEAVEEKGGNVKQIIAKYKEAFALIDSNLEKIVTGRYRESFLQYVRKYMARVKEIEREVKHLEFVKESVNYDPKQLDAMFQEVVSTWSISSKFQQAIASFNN